MTETGLGDWHFGYKPCAAGHVFTWMGGATTDMTKIAEGTPCLCGQTTAHWVACPTCGHERLEAVPHG